MTLNMATLRITPEILSLISEIDEFKGRVARDSERLRQNAYPALRRVATIESIGSSTRIEGSKLSDREVEGLLANLEIGSFATRDEQEVAGYAEVMELDLQRIVIRIPVHRESHQASSTAICWRTATRTNAPSRRVQNASQQC
jgi:hypothetical protein